MAKRFSYKYDIVQLIDNVRRRPCLWDKTTETYKDKIERRNAWEEIFSTIETSYNDLTLEEQRVIGEIILAKWTNLRDTFMKSLKYKNGRPKKKYVYYEHLKFLKKIIPHDDLEEDAHSNDDEANVEYLKEEPETPTKAVRKRSRKVNKGDDDIPGDIPDDIPIKCKKEQMSSNEVEDSDSDSNTEIGFVGCDDADSSKVNDPRLMNEDEAFFASLLPTVVKYNEDDRLEFRIAVLSIMKQIMNKTNE